MTFQTVFDLSQVGYRYWSMPMIPLLFVGIGIVFVRTKGDWYLGPRGFMVPDSFPTTAKPAPAKLVGFFGWAAIVFGGLTAILAFTSGYAEYRSARNALEARHYAVVEGLVTNFVPMPYGGHSEESFTVGGKTFTYSDFNLTAGFNNTRSHGGPIDAGELVRVSYIGNTILRLEIAR
jgi:hypothetical protein